MCNTLTTVFESCEHVLCGPRVARPCAYMTVFLPSIAYPPRDLPRAEKLKRKQYRCRRMKTHPWITVKQEGSCPDCTAEAQQQQAAAEEAAGNEDAEGEVDYGDWAELARWRPLAGRSLEPEEEEEEETMSDMDTGSDDYVFSEIGCASSRTSSSGTNDGEETVTVPKISRREVSVSISSRGSSVGVRTCKQRRRRATHSLAGGQRAKGLSPFVGIMRRAT